MTRNIKTVIQEQLETFQEVIDDTYGYDLPTDVRIMSGVIGTSLIVIDIAILYLVYIISPLVSNIGVGMILMAIVIVLFVTIIIPLFIGGLIGIFKALT